MLLKAPKDFCTSLKVKDFLEKMGFTFKQVEIEGETYTAARYGSLVITKEKSPHHPPEDNAMQLVVASKDMDVLLSPFYLNTKETNKNIVDPFINSIASLVEKDDAKRKRLRVFADKVWAHVAADCDFDYKLTEENAVDFEISGVKVFSLYGSAYGETYFNSFAPNFVSVQIARAASVMPIIRENAGDYKFRVNETRDGIYTMHILPILSRVMHLGIREIREHLEVTYRSSSDERVNALLESQDVKEVTFYELIFDKPFEVTKKGKFNVQQEAVAK